MLVAGLPQSGGKTGARRQTSPAPYVRLQGVIVAPHAQSSLGRRPLFTTVAAHQRRPFDRNLLDNVDSSVPDGYSIYASPAYVPIAEDLESQQPGAWPGSEGPVVQPSTAAVEATSARDDWPHDPQTPTPSPSRERQWQPPRSSRGSFTSSDASSNVSQNGSVYGAASQPEEGSTLSPSWPLHASPSPINAAPSASAAEPPISSAERPPTQRPTQPPSAANGPPSTNGSDWGEVDPLTDWGGIAYGEDSGWDEPYGNNGFVSSSSSSRAPAGSEYGAAAGSGNPNYGPGVWSGDAASSNPQGAPTDWPRQWVDAGAGSWTLPYTSYRNWSRTGFIQDERFGSGAAGAEPTGGPGTVGSSAPPPEAAFQPSDIILLPGRDASSILPLAPMSTQVDFFQPRTLQERVVQFVGSIGASLVLSKAAILAGPALLYPIWNPWIRAGLRNMDLYSKSFSCVGLWRAQVLDVAINGLAIGGIMLSKQPPVVSLLAGDPWAGGARVSLELPYQLRSEGIRVGDSVELLVLSRDDRFTAFKVVREVYLPQSGLWLCDYPYVNRDLFVALSVGVERQRRAEAAAAAEVQYYTYDVPAGPEVGPSSSTPGAMGTGSATAAAATAAAAYEFGRGPDASAEMGTRAGPVGGDSGIAGGFDSGSAAGPTQSSSGNPQDVGGRGAWASGDWR